MQDAGSPLVYVVVLNYNGTDHLPYCLLSICASDYPNLVVLLVDNASSDQSLALAADFHVRILRNAKNLGWSGGNNVGIREALRANAKYIVLANNDIRVHPRWIAEAVAVAESRPDIGVIGFDVHEPQPGSADQDAGYSAACQRWSSVEHAVSSDVGGMAMFVRAVLFEDIGLIDENFFAYGEENDFQIRARRAGFQIATINVPVWHHGVGSFGRTPFRAALLQTENNIQLLLKHQGPLKALSAGFDHLLTRGIRLKRRPASTAVERRLQTGSRLQATVILLLASLHILLKSPAILRRRIEDRERSARVRARRALSDGRPGNSATS